MGITKKCDICDEYFELPDINYGNRICPKCRMEIKKMLEERKEHKTITLKENELYQEIELYAGDTKIGEAEVELNSKMLSRLYIYEPYQDKHYGTEVVKMLNEKYGCNNLWVNADNERAIHCYEKCGYKITKPTMYVMETDK